MSTTPCNTLPFCEHSKRVRNFPKFKKEILGKRIYRNGNLTTLKLSPAFNVNDQLIFFGVAIITKKLDMQMCGCQNGKIS